MAHNHSSRLFTPVTADLDSDSDLGDDHSLKSASSSAKEFTAENQNAADEPSPSRSGFGQKRKHNLEDIESKDDSKKYGFEPNKKPRGDLTHFEDEQEVGSGDEQEEGSGDEQEIGSEDEIIADERDAESAADGSGNATSGNTHSEEGKAIGQDKDIEGFKQNDKANGDGVQEAPPAKVSNSKVTKLEQLNKLLDMDKAFSYKWPKEDLRRSFARLCKQIYMTVENSEGRPLSAEEREECLANITLLEAKYRRLIYGSGSELKGPGGTYPPTLSELKKRMQGAEENEHPWLNAKAENLPAGGILYRAWDPKSKCKMIRGDIGFLSFGSDSDFTTKAGRRDHLEKHANWGNRKKTPFISTTPSIEHLNRRYVALFKGRETHGINMIRITAFNINARVDSAWPILNMHKELAHYTARIPLNSKYGVYENEYLLPFRIHPEEIVGDWHQTDIETWMQNRGTKDIKVWEAEVVQPLYIEHERSRKAGEDDKVRKRKAGGLVEKLMPGAKLTNWYTGVEGHAYA